MVSSMIAILAVAHAIPFQAIEVRHRASKNPGSYPVLKHVVASLWKPNFSYGGIGSRRLMRFKFMVSKLLCYAPQLKLTILVIKGTAPVITVDSFTLQSPGVHLIWECRTSAVNCCSVNKPTAISARRASTSARCSP